MAAITITVSTAAELQGALARATGGETILLAAGNYGVLQLINGFTKFDVTHSATTPVTIRSADAGQPAVLTGLDMRNATGFTFENLTFDYSYKSTDQIWTTPFRVVGGSDITIRGSTFDGDVAVNRSVTDDGFGFAVAFTSGGTKNLTIENNEFYNFTRGPSFSEIDNLAILGNDIHSMRSDGMNLSAVQGVRIENNYLHDFRRSLASEDHPDFIQFWTNGSKRPNTDIVIRNNVLDIGDGNMTQSIFMRNEEVDLGRAGSEMFYRNVLIEQNTIYNDHQAGISLGETVGAVIRNNTVLHANGATEENTGPVSIPIISVATASTDVIITGNVTGRVAGGLQGFSSVPPTWTVSNNLLAQDQDTSAPNHYSDLFLSTSLDRANGDYAFLAKPGGVIETMGVGADRLLIDRTPAVITPRFDVTTLPDDVETHVFDAASTSFGSAGALTPGQGRFIWDFGDGTLATGGVVQHRYATPGTYTVTMAFEQPDGTVTAVSETVTRLPLDLLRFDQTTGQFGIVTDTGETMLALKAGAAIGAVGSKVIDLGAPGTTATVAPKMIEGLFKADNFELDLQIKADIAPNTWGEVFRLHGTFLGTVRSTGDFQFTLWTDAGTTVNLFSKGVNLLDGKPHDIRIRYDADLGTIALKVDGQVSAEVPLAANLPQMGQHGLLFGNPWGSQNFNGQLSHFDLNVERSGYAVYDGATPPVPSALAPLSPADPSAPDAELPPVEAPPVEAPPLEVTALFEVSTLPADSTVLVFDAARNSFSQGGPLTPDQGVFVWDFGDGTFATGGVVQHRYATPGTHDVTLTFVQPDGTATSVSETVERLCPDVLRLDPVTGQFGVTTDTGETLIAAKAGAAVGDVGAKVIDLGAPGTTATIPRGLLGDLFTADNFVLDLQIRADIAPNTWGEVFRLHGTFLASVTRGGDFQFILWPEGSPAVTLTTRGVNLLDGALHDVGIRYDADLGVLRLEVDGEARAETPLAANLPKMGLHDLLFGNPWNGKNFDGQLSHFDLNVERSELPVYDGATPPIPSEVAALAPGDLAGFGLGPAALTESAFDTYLLDEAAMAAMRPDQFGGNARLETVGSQTVLALDGSGDAVMLGLMEAFADADQIAFTLDFQRASAAAPDSGLVANAGQINLGILGDGFQLQVATADEGFKQYEIANLGLQDGDRHEAVVLFDAAGDRLQVYLDDRLVFEDLTTDLVMTNPEGDATGGWTLGKGFAGTIAEFGMTEDLNHPVATGDVVLFA